MNDNNIPEWVTLDNAAKIFPHSTTKRDTRVYRLICSLKENVEKKYLQEALLLTVEDFPLYKAVLKRGLFWYYLETSSLKPVVTEEKDPIFSPLYYGSMSLLFRVSYYKKRINLEVFHVLADGAGGFEFLRSLVANYLKLKYASKFKNKKINLNYNASMSEKLDDSFKKYYDNRGPKKAKIPTNSYLLKGPKYRESRLEVIEGVMSLKELLALARSKKTTLAVLLTALFMKAIKEEMPFRELNKNVVIAIPVNLRQFFNSNSARNFFGVFDVPYNFKKSSDELEVVLDYLNEFFKGKLNYEEMSCRINNLVSLEDNILIRPIPLVIKNYALKFSSKYLDRTSTAQVSNVGRVEMPSEMREYIEFFGATDCTEKMKMCLCSFEDKVYISLVSPFINSNVQKNFYKQLSSLGIKITLTSNANIGG